MLPMPFSLWLKTSFLRVVEALYWVIYSLCFVNQLIGLRGLVSKRGIMSEVRSSEPEIGLSSSDDPVEMGDDTAVFVPREVKAFSTLREECGLNAEVLSRFSQRFQFPRRVRARLPRPEE